MAEDLSRRHRFTISMDPETTDFETVVGFLAQSYWANHVPRDQIIASFRTSLIYNLLDDQSGRQIGFARVISDRVRFAYLSDVFVLDSHRGQGLGTWLIETVMADPVLADVGHWALATSDAQAFYRKLGFEEAVPGRYMVRKS